MQADPSPLLTQSKTEIVMFNSEKPENKSDNITSINLSIDAFLDDDFDTDLYGVSFTELLCSISHSQEDTIIHKNGYKILHKISNTVHTQLFEAKVTKLSFKHVIPGSYVVIKKIDKALFQQHILNTVEGDTDYFKISAEQHLIKQTLTLKYLTVDNEINGNYIVKLVDYFQTNCHFYLVIQNIENTLSLTEFVNTAHKLIHDNKLSLKRYIKCIKRIMWQLIITIHWIHNMMHYCHLNLCLDYIMIENADFIQEKNGLYKINSDVSIKLSELNVMQCVKNKVGLSSHKSFKAQDIWLYGVTFFFCMTGEPLYKLQNAFQALVNNTFYQCLATNNVLKYFKKDDLFSLLNNLLIIDENKRFTANQAVQHKSFESYYKLYVQ